MTLLRRGHAQDSRASATSNEKGRHFTRSASRKVRLRFCRTEGGSQKYCELLRVHFCLVPLLLDTRPDKMEAKVVRIGQTGVMPFWAQLSPSSLSLSLFFLSLSLSLSLFLSVSSSSSLYLNVWTFPLRILLPALCLYPVSLLPGWWLPAASNIWALPLQVPLGRKFLHIKIVSIFVM